MTTPYDTDFYASIHPGAIASAIAIAPRVTGLVRPTSVVDVGSGSGAWLLAFAELGIHDVVGVDGPHVPSAFRAHGEFIEHDLATPLRLGRRFDLAACLEVAEHLPPERATGLVDDLTRLAPVVLFSAAIPGQGGVHHVNEQWAEHWISLFETHGWQCWDAVRPWIRTDPTIEWWYRQNVFLAAKPGNDRNFLGLPRLTGHRPSLPVDYVRSRAEGAPTVIDAAKLAVRAGGRWSRSWLARLTPSIHQ
jgi:SAM-dependent methyltransferase